MIDRRNLIALWFGGFGVFLFIYYYYYIYILYNWKEILYWDLNGKLRFFKPECQKVQQGMLGQRIFVLPTEHLAFSMT